MTFFPTSIMRSRSRSAVVPLLAGALFTATLVASENPGVSGGGGGGCDGQGSGSQSFYWFFRIGEASYQKADMLQLARTPVGEGHYLGSTPRTFDDVFAVSYGENLTTNLAGIDIAMESLELDASLLQVSSLKMKRSTNTEVIERNGGFRQLLTANTLADIVPLAVGYHVRVYDRTAIGAKGSDGLYTIPSGAVAIREAIVRTPGGAAFAGTLELVHIDRKNAGGVRVEVERFIRDLTADTQTKETYAGSLDSSSQVVVGELLEREIVAYSNRGAKPYDYTLVRETSRITTTEAGPQYGTLYLVGRRLEEYRDFTPVAAGGEATYKRLVREVDGYQTPEARETRYTWYDLTSNLMIHGRLKTKVAPDGNWEYYQYSDSEGAAVHQTIKYSAWRDASFGAAADGSQAQLSLARKETVEIGSTTSFTKTVAHAGLATSRKTFSSLPQADGSTLCTLTEQTGIGGTLSVRTWSLNSSTAASHLAGRIAWMENPDGTAETYTYTAQGSGFRLVHKKGAGTRNGVTAGTETTTDYNSFNKAYAETKKDIATGLTLSFWLAPTVDILGRPARIEYNGNSADYETFQYSCCGLAHKRARDGSVSTWTRDPLKRVYSQSSYRFDGDTAPIVTSTKYEPLATIITRGGLLARKTVSLLNGETVSEFGPDQDNDSQPEETTHVTTYPAGGGKVVTTTHPDGGTEIQSTYIDGQPKSRTGTAVADTAWSYGTHTLNGRGLFTKVTKLTAAGGTDEWEQTYRDALGRTVRAEYPSDLDANGTLDRASYVYHSAGALRGARTQLQQVTDPDGKVTTFTYSGEGDRKQTTEQMPQGLSRVTVVTYDVVNDGDLGASRRTVTTVNGITLSTQLKSGDGYLSRSSEFGCQTTKVRTVSTAAGNATVTVTHPDSTKQVQTITANLLEKIAQLNSSGTEVASTTFTYDALRRVSTSTDSRTGTTTTNSYTAAGQPLSVTDPGNRVTAYGYDKRGRRILVDVPNTDQDNVTRTSYFPTGSVKAEWGDQTYATYRTYDEQGRKSGLRTYRGLAHGTEPLEITAGYDLTTWTYHPQRGFLTAKRDAADKGADYTYTPGGQLKTRTWARSVGGNRIVTTYGYDRGLLDTVTYSDGVTPALDYGYDAFGRPRTVTQGSGMAANTHAFAYKNDLNDDGDSETVDLPFGTGLGLHSETVTYGADGLSRTLVRHQDGLLRSAGYQLMNGATIEHSTSYGYDTAGRLEYVDPSYPLPGAPAFTYGYESGSHYLVETVTGPVHTVTNTWESTRDTLDTKINRKTVGTPVDLSGYDYNVNALGQRTAVATSGIAMSSAYSLGWGYNPRGEVTVENYGANSTDDARDRAFQYDSIGNREKTATGTLTLPGSPNYTANGLNQYDAVPSGVQPTYDFDGNATAYPLPVAANANASFEWDAENRLVKITRADATVIEYAYDYLGRRIRKTVGVSQGVRYLYDGWNLIAEYDGTTLAKSYTWGMDLSGTMQGAGGVGGLLSVKEGSTSYYPTYDGNGNVSDYLDVTSSHVAHYEYDAFGNIVASGGAKVGDFAHRFSTKPQDVETGLYYYGYRYYDPVTGRWPSRDPLEEKGGLNLYGFLLNDSVNDSDRLGLESFMACQLKCQRDLRLNILEAGVAAAAAAVGCAALILPWKVLACEIGVNAAYNVAIAKAQAEFDDCLDKCVEDCPISQW